MRVAVPKETAEHEWRVALVPDSAARLVSGGIEVAVETGAGGPAGFADADYTAAGAEVLSDRTALFAGADLVVKVQRPSLDETALLAADTVLIGLLQPGRDDDLLARLAERRITALAMELVPRTTKAQAMDALSSQSTIAGYKAVIIGAAELSKILPMLTTAAGTLAPAQAFVLGAGVAGLQAIATARRLGAVVSAFDVRPVVKEQVESLGATFVEAAAVTAEAETTGGYARELAEDQQRRVLEAVARHIGKMDLVVTTAQIPGRRAPVLITEEMVRSMRPGSVIVDLAAESGGNCVLTRAGEAVRSSGVTIIGPVNLPGTVPLHASQMYSRNIASVVGHLVKDGALAIDLDDPITGPMCTTYDGAVRVGAPA